MDVEGFNAKMAEEKMKSGQARNKNKAAGGKAMILEAEQVGDVLLYKFHRWLCIHVECVGETPWQTVLLQLLFFS